jgi:8-oxo-dGTP diphosphatase
MHSLEVLVIFDGDNVRRGRPEPGGRRWSMGDRSRVVIAQDGKLALIKRIRNGTTYYVFPGGGIEPGETAEVAAMREAHEELGVNVRLGRLVATDRFNDVTVYFYTAQITGGKFGTGCGPEFQPGRGRGIYEPVWVELDALAGVDLRPRQVSKAIVAALTAGEI